MIQYVCPFDSVRRLNNGRRKKIKEISNSISSDGPFWPNLTEYWWAVVNETETESDIFTAPKQINRPLFCFVWALIGMTFYQYLSVILTLNIKMVENFKNSWKKPPTHAKMGLLKINMTKIKICEMKMIREKHYGLCVCLIWKFI